MSTSRLPTLTEKERTITVERLKSSRLALLATLANVSDDQSRFQPPGGKWSILEYAEHLAISEASLLSLVHRLLNTPAQPDLMEKMFAEAAERRQKGGGGGSEHVHTEAPEGLRPKARFASLAEAIAAFEKNRARTLTYAESTQDPLHQHFEQHPTLGTLSAWQWLIGNAVHTETHIAGIESVKRSEGYPHPAGTVAS